MHSLISLLNHFQLKSLISYLLSLISYLFLLSQPKSLISYLFLNLNLLSLISFHAFSYLSYLCSHSLISLLILLSMHSHISLLIHEQKQSFRAHTPTLGGTCLFIHSFVQQTSGKGAGGENKKKQ